MDTILRAAATYFFLLLVFRVAGKRSLAQITTFDLVLVLLISEAAQNALVGNDNSLTNAFLLVLTLVALDIALSLATQRSDAASKILDDVPLVLVENGTPMAERMRRCRVSEDDVMASARQQRGLERMDQIKYAVLERSGGISVIAK